MVMAPDLLPSPCTSACLFAERGSNTAATTFYTLLPFAASSDFTVPFPNSFSSSVPCTATLQVDESAHALLNCFLLVHLCTSHDIPHLPTLSLTVCSHITSLSAPVHLNSECLLHKVPFSAYLACCSCFPRLQQNYTVAPDIYDTLFCFQVPQPAIRSSFML